MKLIEQKRFVTTITFGPGSVILTCMSGYVDAPTSPTLLLTVTTLGVECVDRVNKETAK